MTGAAAGGAALPGLGDLQQAQYQQAAADRDVAYSEAMLAALHELAAIMRVVAERAGPSVTVEGGVAPEAVAQQIYDALEDRLAPAGAGL